MLKFSFVIRIVQGTKVKWEGNGKLGLIVGKGVRVRKREGEKGG
jgi:hypothetical protein